MTEMANDRARGGRAGSSARTAGRRIRTVALVGPDGAGKSTVTRAVVAALPVPGRYLYMGVNLDASDVVLPTTRLAMALKRRRGGRPDMTAGFSRSSAAGESRHGVRRPRGLLRGMRSGARLLAWSAEEWYRQLVAWDYRRRGYLVVMDRHFLCDYWAADVAGPPGRPLASRIHGWVLGHLYPRPDLVFVLDAPTELLRTRRPDDDPAVLEQKRLEYVGLSEALDRTIVIDASAPLADVRDRIVGLIVGQPAVPRDPTPGAPDAANDAADAAADADPAAPSDPAAPTPTGRDPR
jgi:thymidylate kinase